MATDELSCWIDLTLKINPERAKLSLLNFNGYFGSPIWTRITNVLINPPEITGKLMNICPVSIDRIRRGGGTFLQGNRVVGCVHRIPVN
jgi:hypothetical protein